MGAGTIAFRHFEQDSSPGVRVAVDTWNITLTFPVNGRYNSEPEQFLKNIDDIYCSPRFGKCQLVKSDMNNMQYYMNVVVFSSSVIYAHDIFLSTSIKYFYLLLLGTLFFTFCVSRKFVFSSLVCLARKNHVLCIPLYKFKKSHVNI